MDPDVANALFSPSKARQQQAQAKDWDYVTTWLRKKYFSKPIPNFERNEETLQALLNLAAFNERADEEQELIERVEREALKGMQGKIYSPLDEMIYEAITPNLTTTQESALDAQANATILLSAPDSSPTTLAQRTIELTAASFKLTQQLARISNLQKTLETEHQRLQTLLSTIRSDSNDPDSNSGPFSPLAELPQKTSEWTRNTKTMRSKLREYDERLSSLNFSGMHLSPSIEDVAMRQAELREMEGKLAGLEEELRWYGGVPADVGGAREILAREKDQLSALVEERDRIFEGLVESGGGRGR